MHKHIREMLLEAAEQGYMKFSEKLIPNTKPLLGVRLPVLRNMAKELLKSQWREEINSYGGAYEDIYFEEVMLRGMIIGYGTANMELDASLALVEKFIPHVDNWSVCDSFCVSLSMVSKYRGEVWEFLQKYVNSNKEFEVRVALIILLDHYLKFDTDGRKSSRKRSITLADMNLDTWEKNRIKYPYLEGILNILNREFSQGYYAQMAAAWATAEAFVTFPYETVQMLSKENKMDVWTYNKTLQKICESRNPDADTKAWIRLMKKSAT